MSQPVFKRKVYIETTVPSLYHNFRPEAQMVARQEWTREWWDFHSNRYDLVTSAFVIAELKNGEYSGQEDCIRLLDEVPLLDVPDSLDGMIETYVKRFVMPREPSFDAAHLAMASIHRCDILLTWNCVHLANARKSAHIEAVNRDLGLPAPRLATPFELLAEYEEA